MHINCDRLGRCIGMGYPERLSALATNRTMVSLKFTAAYAHLVRTSFFRKSSAHEPGDGEPVRAALSHYAAGLVSALTAAGAAPRRIKSRFFSTVFRPTPFTFTSSSAFLNGPFLTR